MDVLFDNVANPDILNEDINAVILFNVVVPDTFKVDINVVALFKRVVPDTFNDCSEKLIKSIVYVYP